MVRPLIRMEESGDVRARGESAPSSPLVEGLVRAAVAGDRAAFAALVRVFRHEVQRVALRLVGNVEDAEDIAQDAFVRAWGGLSRFREGHAGAVPCERFGGWLIGITVNVARDLQRRRGRAPERAATAALIQMASDAATAPAGEAVEAAHRGPKESMEHRESQAVLDAALAALPERLRTVLVLRAFEGHSYDSIASMLEIRPATARTHMVQARRALKRLVGPLFDGETP